MVQAVFDLFSATNPTEKKRVDDTIFCDGIPSK